MEKKSFLEQIADGITIGSISIGLFFASLSLVNTWKTTNYLTKNDKISAEKSYNIRNDNMCGAVCCLPIILGGIMLKNYNFERESGSC